ncbi:MAG TPA: type II toxin-antitoxin system RelE/ParE family toxin [Roseomonas sp.]|jgi:toxin ParE1/3/4
MGYRTSRQADQDIIDIYLHGAAAFGIEQAERYHAELAAAFERLADHPHLARERVEFSPPVRLHPCRAHIVVYVEHGDGILIIRVLHGRQDWERHL